MTKTGGTQKRERLNHVERVGALLLALLLLGAALWLTIDPPNHNVALAGCTAAKDGCVVAVDSSPATIATALIALAGVGAVLAMLGLRFTSVKAAGIELGAYQAETAGLPEVPPQPASSAEAIRAGGIARDGQPGASPLQVKIRAGLGTELGVVPVAVASLDSPMNTEQAPFLRDYQGAVRVSQNGWFVTHLLGPPTRAGQQYSVAIKVSPHRSATGEVTGARFYLGRAWGHGVFEAMRGTDGRFGITTEAYGPFLAVCEVEFATGKRILLHRYCDFDMGPLVVR